MKLWEELKYIHIMRLVLDNFNVGERFTNRDVKRLIERNNERATCPALHSAKERCTEWIGNHAYSGIVLVAVRHAEGYGVFNATTTELLHYEPNDYQPHELPTGKSFSDRFKDAPWVDMEREQFVVSEQTIVNHDILSDSYVNRRPYFDCDSTLTDYDIVINEPFYGERYVFSIKDNAERIYNNVWRSYKDAVQSCIVCNALEMMEHFELTKEEYVEMVNNLVE